MEPGFLSRTEVRLRRVAAMACVIGASALSLAVANGESQSLAEGMAKTNPVPIQYVGITTNEIWVPDLSEAESRAKEIADTGANAVRIFLPYSPTQAESINDRARTCNAAQAAKDNNLHLTLGTLGVFRDGRVGFVPQTSSAVTKFETTLGDYMNILSGPNACVSDFTKYDIEILNEVNSNTFFKPQYNSAGDWSAPGQYLNLMERVYPFIKTEAAKISEAARRKNPNLPPLDITVIGGALASSHDPVGFIRQMGKAAKFSRLNTPIMDVLSFHSYSLGSMNSAEVEAQLAPKLEKAFQEAFGYPIDMYNDEFGDHTSPPTSKRSLYSGQPASSKNFISESAQAMRVRNTLAVAACQPYLKMVLTFGLRDETDLENGWQAGPEYVDGSHKSSWDSINQSIRAALSGQLDDCSK